MEGCKLEAEDHMVRRRSSPNTTRIPQEHYQLPQRCPAGGGAKPRPKTTILVCIMAASEHLIVALLSFLAA